LVICATGPVEHSQVVAMVSRALDAGGWSLEAMGEHQPAGLRPDQPNPPLPLGGRIVGLDRPVEQAQVLIGCEGLTARDERRHALAVFSAVLGGGMSSRLFQQVREKRGLAYATYSFAAAHADAGAFGVYAACAPGAAAEVGALMEAEWASMAQQGLRPGELERAKGQIIGGTALALEEPYALMNRLGRSETVLGELLPIDEVMARIEAVTAVQVQALAAELADRPRSRVVLGPAEGNLGA
jgi:predicted Zn-dependent peptidase